MIVDEAVYWEILAACDNVIVRFNRCERLTFVNEVFFRVLGGAPDNWLGRSFDLEGRATRSGAWRD